MLEETPAERLMRQFWEHHHLEQLKRFKGLLDKQGLTCDLLTAEIAELEDLLCVTEQKNDRRLGQSRGLKSRLENLLVSILTPKREKRKEGAA
ncbi:hypothetical protein [Paenibacillus donghaensis]|uniref:Uncharacterized protein n=1 Tax=Paenibacillus donghaensis TaxID=414771 RepID=A0A2Z2K9C3_9BACL|nr:hypothetical protein [Paenibacillus donghaensis]ASA21997.1 hypothetical protein B9T62_15170 [Paenibacillus donghaensis]